MEHNKQVQIIIRTTEKERQKIKEKALEKGLSMNEFIKEKLLERNDNNSNINDINIAIIDILKEQLSAKDLQIANLQQIIYNRDAKLLEAPKHWWQFWK